MPRSNKSQKRAEKEAKEDPVRRNEKGLQNVVKFGPANLQEESLLMRLPQELRDKIYSYIFSSTRFASGHKYTECMSTRRVSSAPHGLAFLLSCRRAYLEVGKTWLSQVLFCFETPRAMLDKLSKIPLETRSMIRHVRVSGQPLVIMFMDDDIYYRTYQVLKLLPGLKIDRLTVLSYKVAEVAYETLDFLVKYSDGWKELHYISQTSAFIAYKRNLFTWGGDPDRDRYLREPQPAGWQRDLEDRDGSKSGASVTIYRSTSPHRLGSVMHAATRVEFTQNLSPGQDIKDFSQEEDSQLLAPGEREKEVLVVVKRGRGVDYEEKQGSPYLARGDIRSEFPGKTWMEIKEEQEKLIAGFDDLLFTDDKHEAEEGNDAKHENEVEDENEAEDKSEADDKSEDENGNGDGDEDQDDDFDEPLVDKYNHVDDYVWPPLQLSTQ
ncbi:hypothetical protein V8C37DRAFT_364871 [Trichoderma ceciliae]